MQPAAARQARLLALNLAAQGSKLRSLSGGPLSRRHRVEGWTGGVAAIGLVLAMAPLLRAWSELPDPLATHFDVSGAPDGNMGRTAFAVLTAAQPLLAALMALPAARRSADGSAPGAAVRLTLVGFISALAAAMSSLIVSINAGRASWQEARMEAVRLAAALLFPLLVGGGLALLGRRLWPTPERRPAPLEPMEVMELGETAAVDWCGQASSRWYWAVALAVSAHGAALHWILPPPGSRIIVAVSVAVLILTEHFSLIRVTLDEQALTIRYGRLGWIRQRIALDRIAKAGSFELDPWQHGGWGYRGSLKLGRRAAVVVRGGVALNLELIGGSQLCITVDDAATAARLINGLVQRRSRTSPAAPLAPSAIPK